MSRLRWGAVAGVVGLVIAVATLSGRPGDVPGPGPTFLTPFAADSPWRQEVAADPAIDPRSAAMISSVQQRPALYANLVEFGIPIHRASRTPAHTVECRETDWGVCPFAGWPVPIPEGAAPSSGSDGALVTVDESSGVVFEFWRAVHDGATWSAGWGAVNSLRGSGWGGASTGSGASRLAGVIRLDEIAGGEIRHALALQTSNACKAFRSPALKGDGTSLRADCIPEGARLQLDPELDLSTVGLTRGELAVARAMQRYGGYVVDVGGAPLSVSFEIDTGAPPGELGPIYRSAGFRWDYDAMEKVPWKKLRVLS